MPSTYSANLGIELIATGEQSGVWGNTTNRNLGTLIEEAIGGYVSVTIPSGASTTLTMDDGTSCDARHMYLRLTGGDQAFDLVVPNGQKIYFIYNNTSYVATVKTSAGTGVAVPSGFRALLYCDGTNVVSAFNHFTGAVTITAASGVALTITNTGSSDTLVINDAASDTSPTVVDAAGRWIYGYTSALATFNNGAATPDSQSIGLNANQTLTGIACFSATDATSGAIEFAKSAAAAAGTYTTVADEESLGLIAFSGADGTDFVRAAHVKGVVGGTPGNNDMPGRLVFGTTADGAATVTDRGNINAAGSFIMGSATTPALTGVTNATAAVQAHGTTASYAASLVGNWGATATGAQFVGVKSRANTVGTLGTAVQNADDLISISGYGDDGVSGGNFIEGGRFLMEVDTIGGGVADDIVPTRARLLLMDNAGSLSTRMDIRSAGGIEFTGDTTVDGDLLSTGNKDTVQASTSGTAINFTGIPANVKKITVLFDKVSLSGTDQLLIQIGDAAIETTNYDSSGSVTTSSVGSVSSTAGYIIYTTQATQQVSGAVTLYNITGQTWVASGVLSDKTYAAETFTVAGAKTLSPGPLSRLRVTTTLGTDTFDNGQINIFYE